MLFADRAKVNISDKDFDVLSLLIENAHKFCSFDEIIKAVWGETNVSNNSVEKTIANIRKVLGDDKTNPRFVRTGRGKGYSFICEVYETQENDPSNIINIAQNSVESVEIELINHPPRKHGVSNFKKIVLCSGIIIALLTAVFFAGKGVDLFAKFNTKTVFADDFSEAELNTEIWRAKGQSVKLNDGIIKISADETDRYGKLNSEYFTIDPSKIIIFQSRIKITFSRNIKDKTYFGGSFLIIPKTRDLSGKFSFEEDKESDDKFFGVRYMNFDSRESFNNDESGEEIQVIPAEGFFLVKEGGKPIYKADYANSKISERIEPLWENWFEQKITYDPNNGQMIYFINDQKKAEFYVGKLQAKDNQIRVEISPWGWWVNHSIEIDDIYVTQR